jgi:C_GCAxxG_C_C family probable redox protein
MDKVSAAYALMAERRTNCAQAILSTFSEQFGLERSLALRLAQGFGAGMGQKGNICGAVTGAYMVLGLSQRISTDSPRESLDATYELVREFDRRFKVLHGSVSCRDLTGYDLSTPDGLAEAREKKVFTTVCPGLVRDSATILETMLRLK